MISLYASKILALVMALALAAFATFSAHAEATTITDRVIEPFDTIIEACNGELVYLSGELLLTFHSTIDDQGKLHESFMLIPRNIRGVGSMTGTEYRAVGGDRSIFNVDIDDAPLTYTNTDMFNLVSQGSSDNFLGKFTIHVTFNANGEWTADVDHFSGECVG